MNINVFGTQWFSQGDIVLLLCHRKDRPVFEVGALWSLLVLCWTKR